MSGERMSWEAAVVWLRNQPDQAELVRACFYDDPLTEAAQRYCDSGEWRALKRLLPRRPGRALDLGAGRGITAQALARAGWMTTALEPDPSAIVGANAIRQLVAATGVQISVVEQRAESLPFRDGTFDLVHCRAVLHHARDLRQLCREVARVLVPGGTFIATREHVISRREDLPRFLAEHPLHRLYGGENAYLLEEYTDAIRSAGLKICRVLNPFQSDVNLFPDTMHDLKQRIAARLGLPVARLIPNTVVGWLGARSDQPGRHYTFVLRKKSNA